MSAQFIEEEFIAALNTILRQFFPIHRLRVDRVSNWEERELGYDGTITTSVPIYIQFKRSDFYSANYSGSLKRNRSSLGLTSTCFYGFKLHRDNSTRKGSLVHKQHNLLYDLSQSEEAFYLAPLFHTKYELDNFNFAVHSNLPAPFRYRFYDQNAQRLTRLPRQINELVFDETIGIIPHRKLVDTNHHYYTFDRSFNVTFHSKGEIVENGGFNFFKRLQKSDKFEKGLKSSKAYEVYNKISDFCAREKIVSFKFDIRDIAEYYLTEKVNLSNIEDIPNEKLFLILEYYLKNYFNIHQYILYR